MVERSGFYKNTREDSFVPTAQLKKKTREKAKSDEAPVFEDLPMQGEDWSFEKYSEIGIQRREEYKEIQPDLHYCKISIPTKKPILYVPSSDWHLGAPGTDVELWKKDMELIAGTPGVYTWVIGDPLDYYVWGEGIFEQTANPTFQHKWGMKAMELLRNSKSLLGATPGDHENWSRRAGMSNFYFRWVKDMEAQLMTGIGHLDLEVGDTNYKISMAHRHAGNSIYSHSAAAKRLFRENPGADIVTVGHNHQKEVTTDTINTFEDGLGDVQKPVLFIGTGTYKAEDGWLNKQGYGKGHLGNPSIILFPDHKEFMGFQTIEQGVKMLELLRNEG